MASEIGGILNGEGGKTNKGEKSNFQLYKAKKGSGRGGASGTLNPMQREIK